MDEDVPAFMCRMPQWFLWGLVKPLAGEPLSPVPFHVVGLLLHGLVVALVARAAGRFFGRRTALFAAAAGGLAAGGMQAVSWTAAWSSLTYTLFGALGLELAFAGAVASTCARTWTCRSFAALAMALVILSKAPAIVVPAVVLVLFVEGRARLVPRAGAFVDVAFLLGGSLAGWLVREWFLGASDLSYYEKATPSLVEVARRLPLGLQGLGQALYPWNADPLVEDVAPVLARVTGRAIPAWWLAAAAFGAPTLAALATARRRRVLVLLVALVPAMLPLTMLYEGAATNVASRSAYLPVFIALASWSLACFALRDRRHVVGTLAIGLGALTILDGTLHVARTERAMGSHVEQALSLGLEVLAEAEDATIVAHVPSGGFAGVPALGTHVALALRPPFTAMSEADVRAFADQRRLLSSFHRGELTSDSPFALLQAEPGDESSRSEIARPSGLYEWLLDGHSRPANLLRSGDDYLLREPVPRHWLNDLTVRRTREPADFGKERPTTMGLLDVEGRVLDVLTLPAEPPAWGCELPASLDSLASPAILGVRVLERGSLEPSGLVGPSLLPLKEVPALQISPNAARPLRAFQPELFAGDTDLLERPEDPPRIYPGFTGYSTEQWARVSFTFALHTGEVLSLHSDVTTSDCLLRAYHQEADAPRDPPSAIPWQVLVDEYLTPTFATTRRRSIPFEVSATVRAGASGLIMARYPLQRGSFVDPENTP